MKLRIAVVTSLTICVSALLSSVLGACGGGGGGGGGCGGGGGGGMAGSTLATFVTEDFTGSGNCAWCHTMLTDAAGNNVSIDTHWRSTMMANSAKDPLWEAKVESEVGRSPALAAIIEEKCSRCHMPMARTQAVADGTPVEIFEYGFLDISHCLHDAAMDGISCSLCHQIQPEGLGTHETFTGKYVIDTTTVAPGRPIFAQYPNPMTNPMRMHVGYTPAQGAHTTDSAFCSACHTLYTPVVEANTGLVLDYEFPEQTTYLEWEHTVSAGGVGSVSTCQDCHQPPAAGAVVISNRPCKLPARTPFGMHHFVGGNAFLVKILKANAAELGVTADASHLDATVSRTTSQLASRTASLSIRSAKVTNGVLNVVLDLRNLTGHKLPSGIPARRAWIHLKVTDSRGRLVFESGKALADGSISGNDADGGGGLYEPHYDLIQSPGQVQIYEPIMHDTNGNATYTFLRAAGYLKDNRLLPLGFNKQSADLDIAVYGGAVADANFADGGDVVSYRIGTSGYCGRFTVLAEFLYQSVGYAFFRDLTWESSPLVDRFERYYTAADRTPVRTAVAQVQSN